MTYDSPCVYNLEQDSRKASRESAQTYFFLSPPTLENVADFLRCSDTIESLYFGAQS